MCPAAPSAARFVSLRLLMFDACPAKSEQPYECHRIHAECVCCCLTRQQYDTAEAVLEKACMDSDQPGATCCRLPENTQGPLWGPAGTPMLLKGGRDYLDPVCIHHSGAQLAIALAEALLIFTY